MTIIFFGSSEFAVPTLRALFNSGYSLPAVVTVPDQPVGREHVLTPPPIKREAEKLGLKVLQPETLKNYDFLDEIKALEPDLGVVAAYGKIIPERYLNMPKHGFLNIHPSLLPKYRGPTPIQSAILNGETTTGVTIMVVDKEMDHGPIIRQTTYDQPAWPVGRQPTIFYKQIHDELAELGAKLLVETIPDYVNGKTKPVEQDHSQATFTKFFSRIEGHIDWSQTAGQVYNKIRALNPEPGTWTIWRGALMNIRGSENWKLRITPAYRPGRQPTTYDIGTIIKENGKIIVECGEGYLELDRILLEGKKETSALEFSNGHPDFIGSKFG
ncbi:MAG: Methionyl-tRNA formyltransferase [Candidatus Yanofskybacteria bacterium GW2011_GWA1_48_10]|uniref:Methionyl-tRNA formyltransferase n=2 Tax=Candidatus Yanofskyibacteriota TaxID=1752733 RepID=A0A0G1U7T7_9BACT|nr:MAG: Methionyl-tRNA formyltransferase [Candidatus Yanofskybacteria bacterium GW2011_GWA1_48_10]OGN06581.1 MAG: methionyl-tRNA formyltransferase [Candidatus Yanofskybacteria bacterium RIFCSPHIGHO2_01_FULL_48_25b]